MAKTQTFSNLTTLTQAAVEMFIHLAAESLQEREVFSVALSGGSTPQPLYAALGSPDCCGKIAWEHIHLFWGDERHVPASHPNSNYHTVEKGLLSKIAMPDANIHRVPAELEIKCAAREYEVELHNYFTGKWPRFDLVLLGLGKDGHTASLFPHSSGLNEEKRWFIPNFAPRREAWRLTLTRNAINAARNIVVLVSGESKADILAEVLFGEREPELKPIQYISPKDGEMTWMLDQAAASLLPGRKRA